MTKKSAHLIAMAGLPGTGKSTFAEALGKRLDAVVLSKDAIRAELFSKDTINFSREQDDLCIKVIFIMAGHLLRAGKTAIIDGRTFSRTYQVAELLARARALETRPAIIECVCDDDVAKQRLDRDQQTGAHPAGNRNYGLYAELKKTAEPLAVDRITIDTGKELLERSVDRCIEYIKNLDR